MTRRTSHWPATWIGILALLLLASPALACTTTTSSQLDWEYCWSYQRLIYAGLGIVGSFLISFLVVFPSRVGHWRSYQNAPWPREAYGQSLALAVLLSALSFLLFFAGVENELRQKELRLFPASMGWINLNVRWLAILGGALLLAGLILFLYRHRESASRTAARS